MTHAQTKVRATLNTDTAFFLTMDLGHSLVFRPDIRRRREK